MPDGPFIEESGSIWRRGTTRALEMMAVTPATRPLLSVVQRWRGHQSFAVLTYHRIGGQADPFFTGVSPRRFERQMASLATACNVLPITELLARAESGTLPPAAVGITFDDNYTSVHEVAWPVMRNLGLSGMVFVPTGPLIGMGPLWYDRVSHAFKHAAVARLDELGLPGVDHSHVDTLGRRVRARDRALDLLRGLPENERDDAVRTVEKALRPSTAWHDEPAIEMGSIDQLRADLAEGLEVGSHSVTHPIFSRLERLRTRSELRESRGHLEGWLQRSIETFAYPNGSAGDYSGETIEELESAGYRHAFCTQCGTNREDWREHRYALLRNDATETSAPRLVLRLAALTVAA